jgi:hypothetical protein
MSQRPFSRHGLHRLECECGAYLYTTVAAAETFGLPSCQCGKQFMPARRELALAIGTSTAPCIVEFETAKALGMDDRQAAKWVEQRRREAAKARRMATIGHT